VLSRLDRGFYQMHRRRLAMGSGEGALPIAAGVVNAGVAPRLYNVDIAIRWPYLLLLVDGL